jgi:hypothetical protein
MGADHGVEGVVAAPSHAHDPYLRGVLFEIHKLDHDLPSFY